MEYAVSAWPKPYSVFTRQAQQQSDMIAVMAVIPATTMPVIRELSSRTSTASAFRRRRLWTKRLVLAQVQSAKDSSLSGVSNSGSGNKIFESLMSVTPQQLFNKGPPLNLAAGAGVTAAICVLLFLRFFSKKLRNDVGGSVSELIKRGQLRSDRKTDLRPLKYEDPFNNPLVKMGSKNPIVRMCGKIFRLAPVTLTEEKVVSHQNRRIQAYQWRRPVVFLNEGDPVPEGVDPDEVRWIPSNHPFATTKEFIDEESAQKNVYQTRGVPSRVRAEHQALRKKMKDAADKAQDHPFNKILNEGSLPQAIHSTSADLDPDKKLDERAGSNVADQQSSTDKRE